MLATGTCPAILSIAGMRYVVVVVLLDSALFCAGLTWHTVRHKGEQLPGVSAVSSCVYHAMPHYVPFWRKDTRMLL